MRDRSKSRRASSLIRTLVPDRHLHLQRIATIAWILCNKHSRLFADQQRSATSIATDVIRADRQVSALEALDAMDVEARVEDAVFDDGVALFRRHTACAETWDHQPALGTVGGMGEGEAYCAN